jgi:DNA-directed RNA polymerase specialized sigma24 family protein
VARLPLKQREAVWLRWVTGADYAEIARRLGCSEESARANVYNGMKKLRCELFDLWKKEYVT